MNPSIDNLMDEIERDMQDRRESVKSTFRAVPTGRVWFRRGDNCYGSGWQVRFFFLFLFSSPYSLGLRMWDRGLSFYLKGLHKPLFSKRTNRVLFQVEYLPPCGKPSANAKS